MSVTRIQFPINLEKAERLLAEATPHSNSLTPEEKHEVDAALKDKVVISLAKATYMKMALTTLTGGDVAPVLLAAIISALDLGYGLALEDIRESHKQHLNNLC